MMRGERLLLVEDDAATREVLTLLLGDEGWAVEAAESGEAALALLSRGLVPAVVLCDLRLPGVCGVELARALREVLGGGVGLVAMTASVRAGSGLGYDGVLEKPLAVGAVEAVWRLAGRCAVVERPGEAALPADVVAVADGSECEGEGEAVLEEVTVATLRRQMGDAGARSFYAFALEDAGERVRRMEAALAGQEEAAFVTEAHALKGSCGMMGARRLWRLASEAEMEGLGAGSGDKVSRMDGEIAAVRRMLETIFAI